ncbi:MULTISPECIES: hypothetical protein [unclassified Streptomyces]|uniref:hypothetical protein n=1 Tax=unclassified Streptomyces TaxID=2593676 RepID=UPI0036E88D93
MFELISAIALGIIAVGVLSNFVANRCLQRQVDDLRAEVAIARIEGVLGGSPTGLHDASDEPRKSQPRVAGIGVYVGALIGALVATYGSWLVWA